MINIRIDEEELIEMLVDRVRFWTDDSDIIDLYEAMYENYAEGGCFDGAELNIMSIVDNDYVNWCTVLTEGDEHYAEIKAIYDEQGLGDCSCEDDWYSYIEAEKDGMFLVRS